MLKLQQIIQTLKQCTFRQSLAIQDGKGWALNSNGGLLRVQAKHLYTDDTSPKLAAHHAADQYSCKGLQPGRVDHLQKETFASQDSGEFLAGSDFSEQAPQMSIQSTRLCCNEIPLVVGQAFVGLGGCHSCVMMDNVVQTDSPQLCQA